MELCIEIREVQEVYYLYIYIEKEVKRGTSEESEPLEFEGAAGKPEAEVARRAKVILLQSKYLCFSITSALSVYETIAFRQQYSNLTRPNAKKELHCLPFFPQVTKVIIVRLKYTLCQKYILLKRGKRK